MIRKTAAALVVATGLVLVLAGTASAHPLGNFTLNSYAEVVASGDRLYVVSALDLAEIPTFQARPEVTRLGRAGYGKALARRVRAGLRLTVDGAPRPLLEIRRRLAFLAGAAGLHTTRLEVVLDAGPLSGAARVALRSDLFEGRIGWREIVLRGERGAALASATAPSTSSSDRLLSYPKGQLRSPLDVRSASAEVTPGDAPGVPPTLGETPNTAPVHASEGGFAALVGQQRLGVGVILLSLAIAAFWGAAHALTPGHGKALVAGYLVGTRGRPQDAFLLGATVTVTHTAGVFGLGLVTLLLSRFIVPETLYPWLTLVSGVLVVAVGAAVLRARVRHGEPHHHHDHGHTHAHGRAHRHDHAHGGDRRHAHAHDPLTRRGMLGVGVAAGLLPCPSALVVLLSAIALHRIGFGLALIVAFSLGLAATITAVGLVAVLARRAFGRVSLEGRIVQALPAVSAAVILAVGVAITARALPRVL
jgi:ABC-type nickel/cobalt efflux system permease component RcnA